MGAVVTVSPEQVLYANPYSLHFSPVSVWVLPRGCTPSEISAPVWALQKMQSFRKYPSAPQAAKSLLQHLNHFLPSSFFDHGVTRLFITLFPSLFISMTCFPLSKIHFPRGTASMAERLSCVMCESVGATWNCWCPSQHSYSLSSQSPLPSPYGRGLGTCTSDNLEFPELVMSSAANMSSFLSSQGNTTFIQMVAQ